MNCPKCHRHIVEGFYCCGCGYLPLWREINKPEVKKAA
jgi:hypothetical protein